MVRDGERTADRVRSGILCCPRFTQNFGKKAGYRTYTNFIIEPSPYVDQACIRRQHKWFAIPLCDRRLDEALLWVKRKQAFIRQPMRKTRLTLARPVFSHPRLTSKSIQDTTSNICHEADGWTYISNYAEYLAY